MEINAEFTSTQKTCLKYLFDNKTKEILFGGAAGGGKSWVGCSYLITMCLTYPKTRYLMGRSKLDSLKKTTLNTFFEVCTHWKLKSGEHYTFNGHSNIITFYNGSEIILKDLFLYPSDPNFDNLGSLEITGAFIDEANQITEKAKNIVASRLRYKLDENNLIPKMLMTCNPAKNWVYTEYYRPAKDNKIKPYRKFIQSLVGDNTYISKHYEKQLSELDELRGENLSKDENIAELQEENTELTKQVKELGETPAEEPVKLTKFPKKLQEKVEMSKEDYDKMTSQQKYLYNFNNLNK